MGEGAGRHLAASNWQPSSRDRLSREKMRLACALLGKQNTQHRNPRLWRKPYPGYWAHTVSWAGVLESDRRQILLQADG